MPTIVIVKSDVDNKISRRETPYATRPIITIGEVNGIIENQYERELSGLLTVFDKTKTDNINGIVTINVICCISLSCLDVAAMAANKDE